MYTTAFDDKILSMSHPDRKYRPTTITPNVLGEMRPHGRRKMIQEVVPATNGEARVVLVPEELLPLERNILSYAATLQSGSDQVVEFTGYTLSSQLDRESVGRPLVNNGTIYRGLERLTRWGYLNGRREISSIGGTERMAPKVFYTLTDNGKTRIERESN